MSSFFRRDQSPDLSVSETEIEKLVVELEREMFSDCYTTDEEYKKKSDRLLLRLKDPRNKELCLQALRGGVPSARLIDLSRQGVTEESTVESEPAHQTSLKSESLSPPPPEKPATSRGGDSPSTASASEYEASRRNQPGPLDSSEHRCLTFDINCKLCPDHKPQIKLKDRPKTEKASWVVRVTDEALDLLEPNPSEIESPASPSAEEIDTPAQPAEFCPVVIPPVPLISISGRDPRKAQYQRTLASSHSTPIQPLQPSSKESPKETQAAHVPVPLPPAAPKSILMKPSHSSVHSSYSATMRRVDCVNGTQQFLSKQIIMWKGFLNMPNVSKFVTKGYLISGSADFLKEDLPDTIHIGGRILPQTVWEYVNVIKTSDAKELSLIRFHPSSEEEEVAYVSLFSYFNSRRRFGVVSNVCKHLKDLYLIPLCSKQSLPSVLLPIEGPGLEDDHPNLIMGLAVSQKPKRPDELSLNAVEKKSESLICEESINPSICDLGKHQIKTGDAEISNLYQSLPTFQASSSTLCGLSSMSKPNEVTSVDLHKDSSNPTPLQTILNTLFGSKKQESPEVNQSLSAETLQHVSRPNNTEDLEEDDDDIPYDPEDYDPASASVPLTPVQASEHKKPTIEADHLDERPYDPDDDRPYDPEDDRPYDLDDDRPYDPEEEYSAVVGLEPLRNNLARVSEEPTVNSEVPYDPEDETLFQEMQNYLATDTLPAQSCSSEEKSSNGKETVTCVELSEQQKILEELNRQIEEQKKQLEEQTETLRLQREAIGFSMAHFSVSNALMSPPPQFGRDEDEPEKTFQNEIQIKDPRIYGRINQDLTFFEVESEVMDKECGLKKSSADETEKFEPCSKKTALVSENSLPNEESQKHKSKSSPLENTSKSGDSRRSTSSSHTSSRRSRHDHRSHRNERASSHRRNSERSLKESSERHHRKTPSDGHPSRPRHRDRSSSKKRHHHRDSSPSRYRSRSHYSTDSRRRGASSLENTIQAQRTDQQETESGPESSQHKSDSKQSSNYSEQSVQLQKSTFKHKQLVEVQQEAPLSTRQEADQDHRLKTPRKGSHPVSNKSHDQNQHFSGLSDMFPHETVSLSKQGPLLLSGTTGYGEGLRRQFPKIQPPSTQPLHDQLNLSEPCQADQKRAFPSFNRWNYPETDHIRSRGHPQRGAHSQYQNASLSDNLRCRPFGPDYKGQSCATSAKEGAPALGTGRRQLPSQRQEGPFQERQTDAKLYKACVPPLPEQGVHEDISAHVRMGPRPGTKGFFSPLVPRKFPQHASLRENKSQSGNSFQSECTSYTNNNEQQIPNCPKNYVDDVEGRMQACFPRQSSTLSRNPVHRDIHRHLEGQQFTDNERKHKGEQNFEFRGRQGFFTRDRNMNPTQREGCGDLRRPFSNQDADAPSSGFSPGNRCLNQRDISCFGQPRQSFEFRQKQTDAVPLRLLGPLLPTPPRGPINQSIPRGRRQPSQ
ncbi:hypothetical protein DNTS_030343 [Danionella cerebrum]|uniref:TFIIS central domain-containing protein n=1 Tax=Danionella cerebrum TaxID=2873325 RepID=A0A553QUI0_9TELE|nr:hypothetical protein DNTS_030343 [Danionella translucida]